MKSNLFYSIIISLFFSCKPDVVPTEKIRKIAVHTFTGKGEQGEITNWFYIKNVADRGFSGYYLESTSKVTNFKQSHFFIQKYGLLNLKRNMLPEKKFNFLTQRIYLIIF